jgi:hypothetical protein
MSRYSLLLSLASMPENKSSSKQGLLIHLKQIALVDPVERAAYAIAVRA